MLYYSKVNQLYVYLYPLFPHSFFSHIGHYRVLSRVPCAILEVLISSVLYIVVCMCQPTPPVYIPLVCVCVCVCMKSLQSCLTLCNPMDCSPPSSSIQGILQARNTFPTQGLNSHHFPSPALVGGFFTTSTTWEAHIPLLPP